MPNFRHLLFPFSLPFAGILKLRHLLYDRGILKSFIPNQKTIIIGNLALGGTGKTPHTAFILEHFQDGKMAVLSRGYGRSTKGTKVVETLLKAEDCGDEPLLLKNRFPDTLVVVNEDRTRGLKYIEENHPEIEVVILDDALQHRRVKGGLNILLTTWQSPFNRDLLIPAGNLRDLSERSRKVDLIIVTKAPHPLPHSADKLRSKIRNYAGVPVLFNSLSYGHLIDISTKEVLKLDRNRAVILVTGIANPEPLRQKVDQNFKLIKHFRFRDHYNYSQKDIQELNNFIDNFAPHRPAVITTEKDAVKLAPIWKSDNQITLVYWEIGINFGSETDRFKSLIREYLDKH